MPLKSLWTTNLTIEPVLYGVNLTEEEYDQVAFHGLNIMCVRKFMVGWAERIIKLILTVSYSVTKLAWSHL